MYDDAGYQKAYERPMPPKAPYPVGGIGIDKSMRDKSECEAAYNQLRKAQDDMAAVVSELHNRLGPVLMETCAADGNEKNTTCGPRSEVHGWLIASEERIEAVTKRLQTIIDTLTI